MSTARILVVDDSITIRRALEFILKPQGYQLEFANDGREALRQAVSFAPNLILLDYVLPDMHGPDVCAALSVMEETAATPVILVSAKGASIRQTYRDAQNVVSYITKPFKQEVVVSVVASALARSGTKSPQARPAQANASLMLTPASSEPTTDARGIDSVELRPTSRPLPRCVEDTFAAFLDQLEASMRSGGLTASQATRMVSSDPLVRSRASLVLGREVGLQLRRAAQRVARIEEHLDPAGNLIQYRVRADGSFADITESLLEAHRSLCAAALTLAGVGLRSATTAQPPSVLIAVPAGDARIDLVREAMRKAAPGRAILPDAGFAQLPHLTRLLSPQILVAAPGADPALDHEILSIANSESPTTTRLVALLAERETREGEGSSPVGAFGRFVALIAPEAKEPPPAPYESAVRNIAGLSEILTDAPQAAAGQESETADSSGLEIVSL